MALRKSLLPRHVTKPLEFPGPWVDQHIERFGGWRLAPPKLVEFLAETRRFDEASTEEPRPSALIFAAVNGASLKVRRLSFLGSPADIILHPYDAAANGIIHGQKVRGAHAEWRNLPDRECQRDDPPRCRFDPASGTSLPMSTA